MGLPQLGEDTIFKKGVTASFDFTEKYSTRSAFTEKGRGYRTVFQREEGKDDPPGPLKGFCGREAKGQKKRWAPEKGAPPTGGKPPPLPKKRGGR